MNAKGRFQCPYCREELTGDPDSYSICRFALEFQQQVTQLNAALRRRNIVRSSIFPEDIGVGNRHDA